MKVAAIGDNCVDVYPRLDKYYCTGNSVDFAVHMKHFGADVSFISTTGNDEYGKQMIRELSEEKIDISHLKVEEGSTAISYMDLYSFVPNAALNIATFRLISQYSSSFFI